MAHSMKNLLSQSTINGILFLVILTSSVLSQSKSDSQGMGPNVRERLASNVKTEFLHAWTGYKKYCWGHDDLKPISKTCRDWYGTPIYMTAVDSLDSLYLLGFKKEADETREY